MKVPRDPGTVPGRIMATSQKTFETVFKFESTIRDLIGSAISSKSSVVEFHSNLKLQVYDTNKYQKLPNWAKGKIVSYLEAKRENMKNEYIKIFYIGLDGRKIPTRKAWDMFTEQEKSVIRNGGEIRMVHLWMNKTRETFDDGTIVEKYTPTDKIYWESGMK